MDQTPVLYKVLYKVLNEILVAGIVLACFNYCFLKSQNIDGRTDDLSNKDFYKCTNKCFDVFLSLKCICFYSSCMF